MIRRPCNTTAAAVCRPVPCLRGETDGGQEFAPRRHGPDHRKVHIRRSVVRGFLNHIELWLSAAGVVVILLVPGLLLRQAGASYWQAMAYALVRAAAGLDGQRGGPRGDCQAAARHGPAPAPGLHLHNDSRN
jgi:hypothetical protein